MASGPTFIIPKAGYLRQTKIIAPITSRTGDSINRFDFTPVTTPAP